MADGHILLREVTGKLVGLQQTKNSIDTQQCNNLIAQLKAYLCKKRTTLITAKHNTVHKERGSTTGMITVESTGFTAQ